MWIIATLATVGLLLWYIIKLETKVEQLEFQLYQKDQEIKTKHQYIQYQSTKMNTWKGLYDMAQHSVVILTQEVKSWKDKYDQAETDLVAHLIMQPGAK